METVSQVVQSDQAHLIHPLHHPALHRAPKVWVEGHGAIIKDIEGRQYIDGLAGLWNVDVGHGRRELAQAAYDQMSKLAYASAYAGATNLPAISLAEKLSELAYPSINTFFFTSGGAESTESSFKTARFYWKARGKPEKVKVIARQRAYHGVTLAAMSATGMPGYWSMFEPRVPGFIQIPAPDPYRYVSRSKEATLGIAAANELEAAIVQEGPETVAAFIAEPVQGAGGVIVPPPDYFPRIREICDRYGVLFISDEVITGFGRTGRWFGLEHYGVQPDIMQFAKGITSGYFPFGGIGVSDEIAQAINNAPLTQRWMHAFTYSAHPTGCVVALKNIEIIEKEDLVRRAAEQGKHLLARLHTLNGLEGVGNVRGLGLIAAVEIVANKETKQLFPPEAQLSQRMYEALLEHGLYTRVLFDCICVCPPLVTTEQEIDRIVEIIGETIPVVLDAVS